jgi:hypothetical protein
VSGSVAIQGTASDSGGVSRVVLQVDGVYATETASPAFSLTWTATTGSHTLTVIAYDAAGNAGVAWTRVTVP